MERLWMFRVGQWLVFAFYLLANVFYLREFNYREARDRRRASVFFTSALVLHFFFLLMLGVQFGRLPVATISESISLFVWLTAVVYFILERRLRERFMGGFILPILLILLLYANFMFRFPEKINKILYDVEFEIHVLFMLFAYGAFIISFIASFLHTLLSRELQKRHMGLFYRRLPSLAFFESISNFAVDIGLLFMTVGLALGMRNAMKVWDPARLVDPKILGTFLTYVIYLLHFVSRRFYGWRGQRAAAVSIVGFGWLIFSFLFLAVLFPSIHQFN